VSFKHLNKKEHLLLPRNSCIVNENRYMSGSSILSHIHIMRSIWKIQPYFMSARLCLCTFFLPWKQYVFDSECSQNDKLIREALHALDRSLLITQQLAFYVLCNYSTSNIEMLNFWLTPLFFSACLCIFVYVFTMLWSIFDSFVQLFSFYPYQLHLSLLSAITPLVWHQLHAICITNSGILRFEDW
jgi:hypothetical protein